MKKTNKSLITACICVLAILSSQSYAMTGTVYTYVIAVHKDGSFCNSDWWHMNKNDKISAQVKTFYSQCGVGAKVYKCNLDKGQKAPKDVNFCGSSPDILPNK